MSLIHLSQIISISDHLNHLYFLYEIILHHLIPNSIVFLRVFCPVSVSQLLYLYLHPNQFAKLLI